MMLKVHCSVNLICFDPFLNALISHNTSDYSLELVWIKGINFCP